jgi:hypothetical protein
MGAKHDRGASAQDLASANSMGNHEISSPGQRMRWRRSETNPQQQGSRRRVPGW